MCIKQYTWSEIQSIEIPEDIERDMYRVSESILILKYFMGLYVLDSVIARKYNTTTEPDMFKNHVINTTIESNAVTQNKNERQHVSC
jgi:hypothetical protein